MALPGTYDFTGDGDDGNQIYRGDSRADRHTFTDDSTDPATPLDLSDRTWAAEIRASREPGSTLLATLEVDETDAATGVLVTRLTHTESNKVIPEEGKGMWWDLQGTLTTDPEDVRTFLAGDVEVGGDATRPA